MSEAGETKKAQFSVKREGKNKGRCLSERNGHDDVVVALSEIESRRRRVGRQRGVPPTSFSQENENLTTCITELCCLKIPNLGSLINAFLST